MHKFLDLVKNLGLISSTFFQVHFCSSKSRNAFVNMENLNFGSLFITIITFNHIYLASLLGRISHESFLVTPNIEKMAISQKMSFLADLGKRTCAHPSKGSSIIYVTSRFSIQLPPSLFQPSFVVKIIEISFLITLLLHFLK